ncbi:pectin acetylesterase-family hydrolase [Dokdonella sp.]|uniref:pectin acetylesterase-family hydrolase n=1 Tax=Dokdonella sp. TaxID=2291710 RepID=UPI002F40055D
MRILRVLPICALTLDATLACASSPILDPIFADTFESCRGDPGCWQTVKPAQHDPAWNDARCNDGTPASYEFRPSPTGSDDWVILFQGGGSCDDLTLSCAERGTALTTTTPAADGSWTPITHGGILNTSPDVNPDFHLANLVHFNYCSSDHWSGATAELRANSGTPQCADDDGTCGWQFSGRINASADLASLMRDHGLGDDGTARILFVGTSAGAIGLVANAEAMASALPNARAAGRLHFVVDGGFALEGWDEPNHPIGGSTLTSVDEVADLNRAFWRANFETYCESDRIPQGLDPALCTFGDVYYPYLTSVTDGLGLDVLIQNSTLDAVATSRLHLTDPQDPAREAWRCAMTAALQQVPWLFSSGDVYHTLSVSNTMFDAGPTGGTTYRDLVAAFHNGEPPERVVFDNPPCP